VTLPKQHAINSLWDEYHSKKTIPHHLSMGSLTDKQCLKVKSSIIDLNNHLNEVYPSFNRLHKELSPGFWLVDNFPNYFSFHTVIHKDTKIINAHIHLLNKILEDSSSDPSMVLIISDANIKNNITTSILHVHFSWNFLAKTIHYIVNVISTKAELFSIRCGIN